MRKKKKAYAFKIVFKKKSVVYAYKTDRSRVLGALGAMEALRSIGLKDGTDFAFFKIEVKR